jgi:hypothetical protein
VGGEREVLGEKTGRGGLSTGCGNVENSLAEFKILLDKWNPGYFFMIALYQF